MAVWTMNSKGQDCRRGDDPKAVSFKDEDLNEGNGSREVRSTCVNKTKSTAFRGGVKAGRAQNEGKRGMTPRFLPLVNFVVRL